MTDDIKGQDFEEVEPSPEPEEPEETEEVEEPDEAEETEETPEEAVAQPRTYSQEEVKKMLAEERRYQQRHLQSVADKQVSELRRDFSTKLDEANAQSKMVTDVFSTLVGQLEPAQQEAVGKRMRELQEEQTRKQAADPRQAALASQASMWMSKLNEHDIDMDDERLDFSTPKAFISSARRLHDELTGGTDADESKEMPKRVVEEEAPRQPKPTVPVNTAGARGTRPKTFADAARQYNDGQISRAEYEKWRE